MSRQEHDFVIDRDRPKVDYKSIGIPPDLHLRIKRLSVGLETTMIDIVSRSVALYEADLALKSVANGIDKPDGR